ncbi:hypothetical protein [Bacillus tropicus]|uniref:hypothetical protein n=1 Tax=Bacillus tropicus TaxID=2026188 RepID=UPI00112216A1|nr:hypothetical protein [Bacillus tropicus]MED2993806.1 hypothetical protein [Bacillus tropicus]
MKSQVEYITLVNFLESYPKSIFRLYFHFLEQSPEQDWIIKCKSSNEIITSELIDVLLRLHERDWFEDNNLNSDDIDKFTCEYLDIISEYYTERNFIKGERDSLDIAHWSIIKNLLTFEPSYIRYDYDDNEGRLNERSHPLNHLDIHYTTAGTFKLGFDSSNTRITDRVTFETFKDILENGKMRDNLCYRLK